MTMIRIVSSRAVQLAALAAPATLSLTACGSDPTSAGESGGAEPGSSANASGLACPAGKLSAEGSSAQANGINEIIAAYNAECGDKATIEYNPTGSGAGIKSFYNGLVDFAGSDSALKTEEKDGVVEADKAKERCTGNPAWSLPMVVGPVAFAYKPRGVDKLVLNAEVLAEILNGTIKTWDDLKIVEDVSMTVEPRTVTAFIGPFGCGKSTLLRTLNRMHEVIPGAHVKGSVQLDGTDCTGRALTPSQCAELSAWCSSGPTPSRRCRSTTMSPRACGSTV
jgi:phosphate transport system substrate-binding protein